MTPELSPECIYTIRGAEHLDEAFRQGRKGELTERKKWVRALELLQLARTQNQLLPIVFADGAVIDGLIYWGVIDDLSFDDVTGMRVHFSQLRKLPKKPPLDALTLSSTREPLSTSFIRPYAICQTPDFITKDDEEIVLELDETEDRETRFEGSRCQVLVNRYERDPTARKRCVEHYGFQCSVCDFDFTQRYGEHGRDFIHVHHLKALSEIGERYEVDPIRDLRPVCPNCHAMLHRTTEQIVGIDELKQLLRSSKLSHGLTELPGNRKVRL